MQATRELNAKVRILPSDSVLQPTHMEWFQSTAREIREDYDRLHGKAVEDPQWAGHEGEATWARILKSWLPRSYQVVTRRYIILEDGSRFKDEIDIIIFHPSYPDSLRDRTEVLAGGVAGAFSVKATLRPGDIRDAVKKAVGLRRGLAQRHGTPREQMLGPFPMGLLAHTHSWQEEKSKPADNVYKRLIREDREQVMHPRESLDYLCVADLNFWSTARVPYVQPGSPVAKTQMQKLEGLAASIINPLTDEDAPNCVAAFIVQLLTRISYTDQPVRPWVENLKAMGLLYGGGGEGRSWDLNAVFDETALQELRKNPAAYSGYLV